MRLFLHVGLPKTGTTYLQNVMYLNRAALVEQGVTVVGTQPVHFNAASELAGRRTRRLGKVPDGAWERVLEEVSRVRTPVALISSERYSLLDQQQTRRLADAFADHELHVVVTVRDRLASEPSLWQESVKNGRSWSWEEFCAHAVSDPEVARRRARLDRVFRNWPGCVPESSVHVVTVPGPEAPRTLLLERFCRVLGIEAGLLSLEQVSRNNTSMDMAATELIRRLHARDVPLTPAVERTVIKGWLVPRVLGRRKLTGMPFPEGPRAEQLEQENAWLAELLERRDFDVIGDLADLDGLRKSTEASVSDSDVLEHALDAVFALAQEVAELQQARAGQGSRRRQLLGWRASGA